MTSVNEVFDLLRYPNKIIFHVFMLLY